MHLIFQPSSLDERTTEELKLLGSNGMPLLSLVSRPKRKRECDRGVCFVYPPVLLAHAHRCLRRGTHALASSSSNSKTCHGQRSHYTTRNKFRLYCPSSSDIYANPNTTACSCKLSPLYFVGICRKRLFIPCAKFENKNYTSVYIR